MCPYSRVQRDANYQGVYEGQYSKQYEIKYRVQGRNYDPVFRNR
jgi:hypothetical protein